MSFEFVAEACNIIDVDFEVVFTVGYLFQGNIRTICCCCSCGVLSNQTRSWIVTIGENWFELKCSMLAGPEFSDDWLPW